MDGQARFRARARTLRAEPGGVPAPRERPARQELVGARHRHRRGAGRGLRLLPPCRRVAAPDASPRAAPQGIGAMPPVRACQAVHRNRPGGGPTAGGSVLVGQGQGRPGALGAAGHARSAGGAGTRAASGRQPRHPHGRARPRPQTQPAPLRLRTGKVRHHAA